MPESSVMSTSPDERSSAKEARAREQAAHRAVLARIRPHLAVANILVLLSAVCSVVPFLLIVEAARVLLDGRDEVWTLLGWALAVFAARALLYSGALFWTHLVDADNQLHLRRLVADKLRSVPLGWFGDRRSADVKKVLQDDVEAIHYLVAHAQVEFVAAVTTPALTLGYLFWVDWRIALALLVPLLGYSVALAAMMGREHAQKMQAYEELEKQTEAATIEFVDGIQVIRTFGAAPHSRVASASGSRWPAPCSRTRRSCCSTRRRAPSTRRTRPPSSAGSASSRATRRSWWSRIGCRPSGTPIRSCSSTGAGSSSGAPTRSSSTSTDGTRTSGTSATAPRAGGSPGMAPDRPG